MENEKINNGKVIIENEDSIFNGKSKYVADSGAPYYKIQLRWGGNVNTEATSNGTYVLANEHVDELNTICYAPMLATFGQVPNTVVTRDTSSNAAFNAVYANSWVTTSSERYKENIRPMPDDLARSILDVEIDLYDYKEDYSHIIEDRYNRSGTTAEKAVEVFPEAVIYKDVEGLGRVPDGVDYTRFIPKAIKMIQILEREVENLKSRIDTLERR